MNNFRGFEEADDRIFDLNESELADDVDLSIYLDSEPQMTKRTSKSSNQRQNRIQQSPRSPHYNKTPGVSWDPQSPFLNRQKSYLNSARIQKIPSAFVLPFSGAQQTNKIRTQIQALENRARVHPKFVKSPAVGHSGKVAEKYDQAVINHKMQEVKDELLKYVVTVQEAPDLVALKQSLFKLVTVITRVLEILK